jgi:hypothetical protein
MTGMVTERRTPLRSPRQSWATSRCRCPGCILRWPYGGNHLSLDLVSLRRHLALEGDWNLSQCPPCRQTPSIAERCTRLGAGERQELMLGAESRSFKIRILVQTAVGKPLIKKYLSAQIGATPGQCRCREIYAAEEGCRRRWLKVVWCFSIETNIPRSLSARPRKARA